MKSNHTFSFVGGDMLAKMGAWWFVSYSYYIYVDRTHFNWKRTQTEATRRSVYNRTKEYHVYWLSEVLFMERLDVHGNAGNLKSAEIKSMAQKILSVVSKDNGVSEMQAILDKLKADYERIKRG
jgi:hypothetical protein